jgi:dUTP pyrophosphatase
MTYDLPYKRHSATAKAPSKAYPADAAFDLFADHDAVLGWSSTSIRTNLAVAIPPGHGGVLMGRSGLGKKSFTPLGFVITQLDGTARLGGMIDSGYTDPMVVMLAAIGPQAERAVKAGEAIAQFLIVPIPEMIPYDVGDGELPKGDRGSNGFGSSDGKHRADSTADPHRVATFPGPDGTLFYHPPSGAWYTTLDYPDPREGSEDPPLPDDDGDPEPCDPPPDPERPRRFHHDVETDRALFDEWHRKGRPQLPPLGAEWSEVCRAIREAPEPTAPNVGGTPPDLI